MNCNNCKGYVNTINLLSEENKELKNELKLLKEKEELRKQTAKETSRRFRENRTKRKLYE